MDRKFSRRAILSLTGAASVLPLSAFGALAQGYSLKIGTIGAGNLGGVVGSLWVKAGHEVFFSSLNPDELKQMVSELGPRAHAGTTAQAIAFGDVVLLAVPYRAVPQVGRDFAPPLKGKIIIDACNAIRPRWRGTRGVDKTKGHRRCDGELLSGRAHGPRLQYHWCQSIAAERRADRRQAAGTYRQRRR